MVRQREKVVCRLLDDGLHPSEIADRLKIPRENVYKTATKFARPTNPRLPIGSNRFYQVCHAIASGIPLETTAMAFRTSPRLIERLLRQKPDLPE